MILAQVILPHVRMLDYVQALVDGSGSHLSLAEHVKGAIVIGYAVENVIAVKMFLIHAPQVNRYRHQQKRGNFLKLFCFRFII